MKRVISIGFLCLALVLPLLSQEKVVAQEEKKKSEVAKIKTWKIPDYVRIELNKMVEEFNKRFTERLEIYKEVLRAVSFDHRDMPEDVVMDLKTGVFILRKDFEKLQTVEEVRDEKKIS